MDDSFKEYRTHLVVADQKSQEDFDKTLVTLASSSLGVSLVFAKDFVGDREIVSPAIVFAGWILLASSLAVILLGFYLSRFALRKAIRQLDGGAIHSERTGGWVAIVVEVLNGLSGLLLIAGILLIAMFAFRNLPSPNNGGPANGSSEAAQPQE